MQSDVEKILPKLGFSIEDADKLVGNFSGGWQMKVALGKIILQKPDLLYWMNHQSFRFRNYFLVGRISIIA